MTPLPRAAAAAPDTRTRAGVLVDLLRKRRRLLVLTHTNPDPDSLGSAVGMREFATQVAGLESTFALTGRILRAENQEMVRQLGIEMVPLASLDLRSFDCAALVDTQPGFGHTLVPAECPVEIVVDHHICGDVHKQLANVPFVDVRSEVGATSSLVTSYFREIGALPTVATATALAYGLRTDTADLSRNVSDLDLQAYDFLFPLIDRQKMVAITRPRLPAAYFETLRKALSKVRIYGHLVLCSLGRTGSGEMVAEVADLLLRLEGAKAVFCGGLVDRTYYVSVRTDPAFADAWRLIRAAIGAEEGSCGGHGSVAGGSIQMPDDEARTLKRLERRLQRNILKALAVEGSNATALGDQED